MRIFPRRRMWLALTGILVCAILFFGILSVVYWLKFSTSAYFGEAENIYVLASNGSATVKQSQVPLALAPALINLSGIEVVSPELFIYGVLDDKAVIIRGIFPSDFVRLEPLRIVEGRWLREMDIKGAVAGVNLARKLHLKVNDTYVLSGSEVDDFIMIKIVGIFQGDGMIDDDLLLNMKYARFLQRETPEGYASIIRARVDTDIWPNVESVWEAVSGPPNVTSFQYSPTHPNNTEKITIRCEARALNQIGSVILHYEKLGTKRISLKTMTWVGGDAYETQIGPVKDTPWINFWIKATDVLGHESETKPINVSITDALGPEIFDVDIEPPPPQTKDHSINLTFKVTDTSELVRNVTVHTSNVGVNESYPQRDSPGGLYVAPLGRFNPGELLIWITAKDRFGNPSRSSYYSYRILNRTDQSPPEIYEMIFEPQPPYDNSTVNLTVRIVDESNITVANLLYDYQVKGIHFNGTLGLNRSLEARDFWTAVTGPFPGATYVHFRIYARDEFGNARSRTEDVFVRYSSPPEILDVYRFPQYSQPEMNNLLFLNLYDASEISEVNVTFHDRGRWMNLSMPVELTTFREPLFLRRLSPGVKEYSVAMLDRSGEITRTPTEGLLFFLVNNRPPYVFDLTYPLVEPPGRPLKVSFLASSDFPLYHLYLTDSRGVIEYCVLSGSEYVGILGPYWKPGEYSFTVNAEDAAGNVYKSKEMFLTISDEVIQNIDFSPKAPLIGEDLAVTCRVLGDFPQARVELIALVGGSLKRIPMAMEGGLRRATIRVDQPGMILFLIEAQSGEDTYRSKAYRISVGSPGPSIYTSYAPAFPTSSEDLVIQIHARDTDKIDVVYIDYRNATGDGEYREIWQPHGENFSTNFRPGTQLAGELEYRVTAMGQKGSTTYKVGSEEWITIPVARNIFDPPEIIHQWLSPQTYVDFEGVQGDDFLVRADAIVRDEEGVSKVWIEYEVGDRTYKDAMLPAIGYPASYTAYLGPFSINETITARISATDIAGLSSSTPYFKYTLRDLTPPEITDVYHDPFEPSPNEEMTIGCEVTDDSGVKEVLLITNTTGQEIAERMDRYGNTYTLKIFSPQAGGIITYRISATDNYGNSNETTIYAIRSRDESPPEIINVYHEPLEPTDEESVNITVVVRDGEDAVQNVTLYWYQFEWKWKTQPGGMGLLFRTFEIDASEFEPGTDVRYMVEAYDVSGNRAVFPGAERPEVEVSPAPEEGIGRPHLGQHLGQEAYEPYLRFRVVDKTPPTISLVAYPTSPNELQTVSFSIEAMDNHMLRNLTLHLYVDDIYMPFEKEIGRPTFQIETDSGPLKPGGSIVYYLEAYDQSGNYARYPSSSNYSISVARLEWGGQYAVIDPRVNLEVAGPAGFSEDMARQGAGKIITSINGILFMTFLATIAGIGNIVYTSIYKSKREIGIVRTLGGSKKYLALLVASLTILVGFLAGLLGVAFSYLLITAFSKLGATLAWVTLRPTFNVLIMGATIAASITISLFGGMIALTRLFSYTPVESIRTVIPPAAKEEYPVYIDRTMRFPKKTIAVLLLLTVAAGATIRLYPTYTSGEPFDPDSWLHLKVAGDMATSGHIDLGYDSRELQAVSALPGLNILLLFSQRLTGTEIVAARILTPIISSLGLIFVFVIARRVSRSDLVGAFACIVLAFAGYYTNRSAALTKEALALQMLLFCLFLLYLAHSLRSRKLKMALFLASVPLMLTHHLTSIYFVLVLGGYVAVTNLLKYSRGLLDRQETRQDGVMALAILSTFLLITFTLGRYETQIPFQDALLILSLFFISIGFGRLLLASSFLERHRRTITLAFVAGMVAFPIIANRTGLFSWAPWEQVMPMLGPHLVLLGMASLAIFPLSLLEEEEKGFLLAWTSAVIPFLLFGLVKRDLFGYILLFRNISYGYQLAAVFAGIAFVYFFKRFEWGRTSKLRSLVIVMLTILLACNIGLASYMGFLSQDYERKDLYHPRELDAALRANASTLRGQLVGADERARRLLLYVTGEDGDQVTTYVYLVRMEKYLINRLREQVEMTDRPLTHIFTYENMYTVGFIDTVLFKKIDRLKLNRFEDVLFDNGDNELIYIARKEWP